MDLYQQGGLVTVLTYLIMTQLKKILNKSWLPLISLMISTAIAGGISFAFGLDWKQTLISGLAGGASSMGLHDTVRSFKR